MIAARAELVSQASFDQLSEVLFLLPGLEPVFYTDYSRRRRG